MPGNPASYLNTGSSRLTSMLNTPIPGVDSPGFDSLSSSYDTGTQAGIGNIASRGLVSTGAVPSMFRDAGTAYEEGASQVVAQGAQEQNQQRLQILNALLGLGSAGLNVTRANEGSTLENTGGGADILEGLFGAPSSPNFLTGAPGSGGGLLSTGVKNLLSQLGF